MIAIKSKQNGIMAVASEASVQLSAWPPELWSVSVHAGEHHFTAYRSTSRELAEAVFEAIGNALANATTGNSSNYVDVDWITEVALKNAV